MDAADADAESLAYLNGAGNAIIKVDNSSTVLGAGIQYRKSVRRPFSLNLLHLRVRTQVRLTSKAQFSIGTLFVIDLLHMPYGCSVRLVFQWGSIRA